VKKTPETASSIQSVNFKDNFEDNVHHFNRLDGNVLAVISNINVIAPFYMTSGTHTGG